MIEESKPITMPAHLVKDMTEHQKERVEKMARGVFALECLLPVAQGYTGQSGVVAGFLLHLYNSRAYPFELSDLRRLDRSLSEAALIVLALDIIAYKEIHKYVENGDDIWQGMARAWFPEKFKDD